MSEHTPGPAHTPGKWRATKHTDTKGWTVSAGGNSLASVKARPEAEANAYLMAAAPDLLEAAVAAREFLESLSDGQRDSSYMEAVADLTDAIEQTRRP